MDSAFGNWLAGFAAGEGCFLIQKNGRGARYCCFTIALHVDDEPILRLCAERTGLGRVTVGHPPSQRGGRVIWHIRAKAECLALVGIFERHPLRAKKREDFEVWAEAVRAWCDHEYGDWAEIDALRDKLREGRTQRGRKAWVT